MIISASRRTDISAFFSEWFFNRIKEGSVCVRNPMNVHQVSRISLSSDVVDCIVFWTKNPALMIPRLDELSDYAFYFQYTLNNYGAETEPSVPPLEKRIAAFRELASKIGKERVIWRYDPIIITPKYDVDFHIESMRRIAGKLRDFTEKCVFSFVDIYPTKNMKNMELLQSRPATEGELEKLLGAVMEISQENGITAATCAEKVDLEKYGIEHNSCIDGRLIERITGYELKTKSNGQREACRCVKCEEIGCYDTCPHGCTYCYANFRAQAEKEKMMKYDPNSTILCDSVSESDIVTERALKSLKIGRLPTVKTDFEQMTLF